jgi:hypothetical protein
MSEHVNAIDVAPERLGIPTPEELPTFDPATTPWLHVYAQDLSHDDAAIVGTRSGLAALRDALDAALAAADGKTKAEVFVNDGEGYLLTVAVVSGEKMVEMAVPYTDDCAREKRSGTVWPLQLISV